MPNAIFTRNERRRLPNRRTRAGESVRAPPPCPTGVPCMKVLASTCAVGLLSAAVALAVQAAASAPTPRDDRAATHITRAANGHALTAPSQAAPSTIVANFLRGKGHGSGAVNGLRVRSDAPDRKGIRQLRMQQEVGGLVVQGAYVKAAIGRNGTLLSVIENLAPVPARCLQSAKLDQTASLTV